MQVLNNSINLSSQVRAKQEQKVAFGGAEKSEYNNPVSMKAEYTVATIGSIIGSAIVGTAAGVIAHLAKASRAAESETISKRFGIMLGAAVGAGALIITLGPKLYATSIRGDIKKKEYDVFSREKAAETTLTEKIDQQAKNDEVPLSEAIGNYAKFEMGKKGNGVGIAQL